MQLANGIENHGHEALLRALMDSLRTCLPDPAQAPILAALESGLDGLLVRLWCRNVDMDAAFWRAYLDELAWEVARYDATTDPRELGASLARMIEARLSLPAIAA